MAHSQQQNWQACLHLNVSSDFCIQRVKRTKSVLCRQLVQIKAFSFNVWLLFQLMIKHFLTFSNCFCRFKWKRLTELHVGKISTNTPKDKTHQQRAAKHHNHWPHRENQISQFDIPYVISSRSHLFPHLWKLTGDSFRE